MIQRCQTCGTQFELTADDLAFYQRISPTCHSQLLPFPSPKKCPICRQQQRLAYRNERNLYRRTSDLSGTPLLSVHAPGKDLKVMGAHEWWSDSWDASDAARAYNFSRSFFEQYQDLRRAVPTKALSVMGCENCEYNNDLHSSKNCYLVFGSAHCEDCFFASGSIKLKDCADVWWSSNLELCASIFCSESLTNCFSCDRCSNSHDLLFCRDCDSCANCLGCCALYQRQFCIFNVQYSKYEYEAYLGRLARGSYRQFQTLREQVSAHFLTAPYQAIEGMAFENCSGDIIYRSRNCTRCFTITDCEDCKYLSQCGRSRDCYDSDYVYDGEGLVYESIGCSGLSHCAFLTESHHCADSYYLTECYNLQNCFGCVGLRNKRYCILNRQYTEDGYHQMLQGLFAALTKTGEWGTSPPLQFSPFGYNESDAATLYPLNKSQARLIGARWTDYEKPALSTPLVLAARDLPDQISEVTDQILENAIQCESSGRLFRIQAAELAFYRRALLPLPRQHPEVRFQHMLRICNPRALYLRQCPTCSQTIETTYAPDRPEKVLCKQCYLSETHV